jgi:hypothetical protein
MEAPLLLTMLNHGSSQSQKAVDNKCAQKNDRDKDDNRRKIDPSIVDRQFRSDGIHDRFGYIVNEPDNRIIWIRINPGQYGAGDYDPHQKEQHKIHHFGCCQQKIAYNIHAKRSLSDKGWFCNMACWNLQQGKNTTFSLDSSRLFMGLQEYGGGNRDLGISYQMSVNNMGSP